MTKKTPFAFLALFLAFAPTGCSVAEQRAAPVTESRAPVHDAASHFRNLNGCFVLFDMSRNELIEVYNKRRCKKRLPACSTFKLPLAVMAFDSGALANETTVLKWDGKTRMIDDWNHDHNARTWLRDSVLWFSQKLTPRIGRARIQKYLTAFKYGNQNFKGGLTDAWLTAAPFMKSRPRTSIKISALDQIDFLKALWSERLSASPRAIELTKKIIPRETSPKGFTLAGKTGSGFVGRHHDRRLGWYVAHLQGRDGHEYVSVVTFTDKARGAHGLAGKESRRIMKDLLAERGLW